MTASERIRAERYNRYADENGWPRWIPGERPLPNDQREPNRCYCPGDCNCRYQGAPWNRTNYCGCKAHS